MCVCVCVCVCVRENGPCAMTWSREDNCPGDALSSSFLFYPLTSLLTAQAFGRLNMDFRWSQTCRHLFNFMDLFLTLPSFQNHFSNVTNPTSGNLSIPPLLSAPEDFILMSPPLCHSRTEWLCWKPCSPISCQSPVRTGLLPSPHLA